MRLGFALVFALAVAIGALAATHPDPNAQAQVDGCARDIGGIVKNEAPTWVYVGDRGVAADAPPPAPRWARGVVNSPVPQLASHPAGVDDPFAHDSYDANFNVLPDRGSADLLGGDPVAHTGNFAGDPVGDEELARLHIELEEAAFPFFAWPESGNRVQVLGSWVWDCGHWTPGGERTELHPFRAIWVDRGVSPRSPSGETEGDLLITTDKTEAGKQADCAHRTKGDRTAFKACLAVESGWQDVNGSYRFLLPLPPRPGPGAKPRVRVVDAGSVAAPPVRAVATAKGVAVALDVSAPVSRRVVVAKRILAGWSPVPAAARPEHLRLTFERLLVRRAMDPGCPNGRPGCHSVETTREDQISQAPGEWLVYWDVAGIWGTMKPRPLLVRDGQVVKGGQAVDLFVPRGHSWRLLVYARECDFGAVNIFPCPKTGEFGNAVGDDVPGVVYDRWRSPGASLGRHRSNSRLDSGSSCPRVNRLGCYQVAYRVVRAGQRRALSSGQRPRKAGTMPTTQTKRTTKAADKDLITRLADAGEDAVQRLGELPGGKTMVEAATTLRARLDELAMRIRAIDPLEKRVASIEKRLAALEHKSKPPARRTAAKSTKTEH